MNASWDCGEKRRDDFAGSLADAALVVTANQSVRGSSVDRELELWHSMGDVVRETGCAPGREETLLARLTDAAYQVALAHGTARPFIELELELWHSLRRALGGGAPRVADA
ncbi:MAG TPA: hypothetical protein VFW33_02360 [Gemmataceae bacterium]|nr:hypothetical protein [Gemmataceae bacterium]